MYLSTARPWHQILGVVIHVVVLQIVSTTSQQEEQHLLVVVDARQLAELVMNGRMEQSVSKLCEVWKTPWSHLY